MQTVSSGFTTAVTSMVKTIYPSCLISWKKTYTPTTKFFTLDQSNLDGPDVLKGPGGTVTFFDKYDYVNETKYVKNFRITKKISSRPWGVIMATAEIELNNTTKRFYPGFDPTIGAYTELQGRPIKLGAGINGEFITLFTGYAKKPTHQLSKRTSTMTAFDAMTYLSTVKSNLGAFVNQKADYIIKQLLIEQGFSTAQFNIEPSLQQTIGYLMPKDQFVTDIFNDICAAEGYIMHADENGIIQGWNRLHLLGTRTSVWTFNYSNLSDINWASAPIINSAQVVAKPFKPASFNKLFETDSVSDDRYIPPGQSKDIFVEFKDDLGSFPAISVDTPVYISSGTGSSTYSTNFASDGSSDTGQSFITLSSVYNFGSKYRMTFTNSNTTHGIYITKITLFGQPAKVTAIKSDVQEDSVSIGKYELNPDNNNETYVIENDLIQDMATANSMAWMLVDSYKNAASRLDVDNFVVPQIQFGDPVNVYVADIATTKSCNVLGTELFFGVGGNLTQKLYVEQRPTKTYFQLDRSTLDGSDALAL